VTVEGAVGFHIPRKALVSRTNGDTNASPLWDISEQMKGEAMEEEIAVPSGQKVTLLEVISNVPGPEGLTVRFRFLAPAIAKDGGTVDAEAASLDMDHLCQAYALDRIASIGPAPAQIIISMSDRDVPFGETRPDATQLFNAYSIADGTCVWEMF